MSVNLSKFFTREAIAGTLGRLPELKTPVMDLIYPQRVNHPFPVVGYQDLGLPVGNIPVVKRGTQSYALAPKDGSIGIIEPQPVNPSVFLSGADLNNFKMLDGQGQQQLIDNKTDQLRRACRSTAEALAAQSLSGAISYPLRGEGGALLSYDVDFGTPATVAIAKRWDAVDIKIADIISDIGKIADALKKTSPGMDIVLACGYDVYAALVNVLGALPNSSVAQVGPDFISIGGGIKIMLLSATYTNIATGAAVSAIPAKRIIAIDRSAGFKLFYAALDNLDAGLVPMPFFVQPVESKDPSGIKLIAESKPLPVPNVKGIVIAQALT